MVLYFLFIVVKRLFLFSYNGLRKAVSLNHWHLLVFQYFSEFSTWKPPFCFGSLLHLCRWNYVPWGSDLFYLAAAPEKNANVLGQRSTFHRGHCPLPPVAFSPLRLSPSSLLLSESPESLAACASATSPTAMGLDPAWSPYGFPSHPARLQLFSVTK